MKWVIVASVSVAVLVAVIAAIGSFLPRNHTATRSLAVRRTPQEVWPVVTKLTAASSVPVDVIEEAPPRRLVTRVKESEKMFGGTWTIEIAPAPGGSTITITEDGWVANPVFRFVSRFIVGHYATMDGILRQVDAALGQEANRL